MATGIRLAVGLQSAVRPKSQPLRTYGLARGSKYVNSLDLFEFVNYGLPAFGTTCVKFYFDVVNNPRRDSCDEASRLIVSASSTYRTVDWP